MKRTLLIVIVALLVIGKAVVGNEVPAVNLPLKARQWNWTDSSNNGSCVFATMVMLFRWQGRTDLANICLQYVGGSGSARLQAVLDSHGVRFAQTIEGDIEFLKWACSTRRGCGVNIRPSTPAGQWHFILLADMTKDYVWLLDNNSIKQYQKMPLKTFLKMWGGWAVTPLYSPMPPLPEAK